MTVTIGPVPPIVETILLGPSRAKTIMMVMTSSITLTKECGSNWDRDIGLTVLVALRGVSVCTLVCTLLMTRPP